MSNTVNQLGGKCPYMPFLGRGQMSGGGGGGGGTCPTLGYFVLNFLYSSTTKHKMQL